ncbi:hypothetical protein [Brucella anthropi]|uniref:hypothetical protein n=1 Tax=Brucella anthropi TaxID=529 RepID=UPI00125D42AF|nr:hypothetical protein [Brucella anthropi]QFP64511.1 hypothetical protein FT787_15405 [Brucella anthropi]
MAALNEITSSFRHVRLLLAREKNHPEGASREGIDLLIPLDSNGRLDFRQWKSHQELCRVRYFNQHGTVKVGLLKYRPVDQWYIDFKEGEQDDEVGFRLGAESFTIGEYVAINAPGKNHTYRVARVEKP